jgi:hypothetical protein
MRDCGMSSSGGGMNSTAFVANQTLVLRGWRAAVAGGGGYGEEGEGTKGATSAICEQ